MTKPKNATPEAEADDNVLSDEELEAATGGVLNLSQNKVNASLSSQQIVGPADVKAGVVPTVKDTLL